MIITLEDCFVVVIRNEETRPTVIEAFASAEDRTRTLQWALSQPELANLLMRALRLEGRIDEHFDQLNTTAGGEPGDDTAWLDAWARLDPGERRRIMGS